MTRTEHLLTILAEECAEVAQRASKALRFGLLEVQPGQEQTNTQRLEGEMCDLIAVWNLLRDMGLVKPIEYFTFVGKAAKVEKFLAYSKKCGTLGADDQDGVWVCSSCGSRVKPETDTRVRWNGTAYEHACDGPQVGAHPCRKF